MKAFNLIIIVLLTIVLSGCNSKKDTTYDNVDQMITDAQAGITHVSINNLKEKLNHKGGYIIIDCRESAEFIEGHIPGAVNIPRGLLEFSSKVSNRREAIYMYSETIARASLAYPVLKSLKYKRVYLIDGGWEAWLKEYPNLIELGLGKAEGETPPQKEESGGCGG